MSREIKFRAWDKEEKCMIFDVQNTYDYGAGGCKAMEESFGCLLKNRDFEVMQYTGIHDKNGKEIYEGDILKDVGEIKFGVWYAYLENGLGGSYHITGFYIPGDSGEPDRPIEDDQFNEVIGNIYENPELLSKEV